MWLHPLKKYMTMFYWINNSGKVTIPGRWSKDGGWKFTREIKASHLTLNGRQRRVVTVADDKFNIKKEINGTLVFIGYHVDHLYLLADLLNFTCVIFEPSDGFSGSDFDGDSTCNGVIGLVQKNQGDIVMVPFSQTVSRRIVVDFLEYLEHGEITMLMIKPKNSLTYGFCAFLSKPKILPLLLQYSFLPLSSLVS